MMPLWLDLAASKPGLGCLGPIVMAFPFRLKQRKMVWELRGRDTHMKSGRVFIILHWRVARQLRLSTDSWISLDTINYSFPTSLLWHFHIVEILWKERKQISWYGFNISTTEILFKSLHIPAYLDLTYPENHLKQCSSKCYGPSISKFLGLLVLQKQFPRSYGIDLWHWCSAVHFTQAL